MAAGKKKGVRIRTSVTVQLNGKFIAPGEREVSLDVAEDLIARGFAVATEPRCEPKAEE